MMISFACLHVYFRMAFCSFVNASRSFLFLGTRYASLIFFFEFDASLILLVLLARSSDSSNKRQKLTCWGSEAKQAYKLMLVLQRSGPELAVLRFFSLTVSCVALLFMYAGIDHDTA